ncbi:MAG TPA: hypothetical protein VGB82_27225, partial [Alphaproteobacteria bacterium]
RDISGAAARASGEMASIGQVFGRHSQDLTAATETGKARVDAFGDAFRRLAEEVTVAVSQAAARIAAIGDSFDRHTRGLAIASADAQEKMTAAEKRLADHARQLTDAGNRTNDQAREAADLFRKQAEDLAAAAAVAKAQADQLTANELAVKRASFLRASRLIVDSLNSLAIDFSRVLDPSTSERLLREFIGGDRGVFVRRLLRLGQSDTETKVQGRYHEDPEFRKYVDDYLAQFDRLLVESRETDPENILSATYLSSDVGKLYLMLTSTLGRKH